MALDQFTPPTRAWFQAAFGEPTPAQARGWPAIAAGEHTLIHAPTGSGKTLAAFLWALDRLLTEPMPERDERCRVLYVSPLKALAHDVERNLAEPLSGIRLAAERLGAEPPSISTFIRTGDTKAEDRRRMERHPPDILITTPESLYLMLTSSVRSVLRTVRWVIVDEVHAVAGTKRGAHLAISLERLDDLADTPPQRIGLSATQRPLETISRFLGGGEVIDDVWTPRPVTVVDVPSDRELDLLVEVPAEDMTQPTEEPDDANSMWTAIYPRLLELILAHRSTIVFANSRRLAERTCAAINALAGEEVARAHHGSVAREQRLAIEEGLKSGELRAVVATSSLELGIDMGTVDLVIQIEAPTSVASGLQRVGRAGHQVGGVSTGRIFPKYRGDLLAATVVASLMSRRQVEETRIPANPLDVLAQQIVAHVVATGGVAAGDLYGLVRRSAPYASLTRHAFDATLDMLAGRYPSDLFAALRPRVVWDREQDLVTPRDGARHLVVTNAGTIPDRGLFVAALPDGSRVGELDEEMVYESRVGDTFLLGTTVWRINSIGHDRVEVVPAPANTPGRMPFWKGDTLGRPAETGREIGRFVRRIQELGDGAVETLIAENHLDERAARNLVSYVEEQEAVTSAVPSDRTVIVERFRDELGDWRVVIHSPLGARVHAPWAFALQHRFRSRYGTGLDMVWSDDGISFRFPDADEPPDTEAFVLDPEEARELLIEHLANTSIFAARFREAAGRALLLPRRRPGQRTPLWLQRRRSADLLGVAQQFDSFPLVLETYREVLNDDFDLPAFIGLMSDIAARRVTVTSADTTGPSPFAVSLLFSFVAAYLYEADAPAAERRATALSIDRSLLRELLGEGELRELIDPEVVAAIELELQHLVESRRAGSADAVADLLSDLGPLSLHDIDARSTGIDVVTVLQQLKGRVIEVEIGGQRRWAAIEDAGRLAHALGVEIPESVPPVFNEPVRDALGDLVGRFARTHGPFTAADAGKSLGIPAGVAETALRQLESQGRVAEGAFRPGGEGREWVDSEVLRRLKRRSLAVLRGEIEPVPATALASFVPAWQGVSADPPSGLHALRQALDGLTGAAVPASVLELDILPVRVAESEMGIDSLMLSGELIWVGRGRLGSRDGRIALYPRHMLGTLWPGPEETALDGDAAAVLDFLSSHGASFFTEIYQGTGGGPPDERLEALWDLVWAGLVTNDTLQPVRAYLGHRKRKGTGKPGLSSRFPAHSGGRWSLTPRADATDTERATAWAQVLLSRQGVVARDTVAAEGLPGGFTSVYPVLSHMEETGKIRRGYFVEGLGGAQFALPGAVDRLRRGGPVAPIALAATDPANVYGSVLPWPAAGARLAREPGAYVVLAGGELLAYLDRSRSGLWVFPAAKDQPEVIASALAGIARRHRRFNLQVVNGTPAAAAPLAPALTEWGFAPAPKGLSFRG